MKLSAELLDRWDRCERRFAFSQRYEPKMITALGILYAALDAALVSPDPEQAAKDTAMRLASRKAMVLTEINKFTTVRHVESLAAIISVALRRRLGELEKVQYWTDGEIGWDSALYRDKDGNLHRIELVAHFDDDRLRSCAHSWRVIGEMAALRSPIVLTMVVIGTQRGGRRHSPWTKGLLHPVNKALRFAPRNAKKAGFGDTWNQVWREQKLEIPTELWLGQMHKDGVLDDLIVSRRVGYKPEDHRMVAAREEMIQISESMSSASESAPMRRSSCDEWGGCPFSPVCYSITQKSPDDFPNLYSPLDTLQVKLVKRRLPEDSAVSSRLAQVVPIA
jgi:hypothetical protein